MPHSPCVDIDRTGQNLLLSIARQAIEDGIALDAAPRIELEPLAAPLKIESAVFVTLTQSGALRGCVGSLQALDPLAQAVSNSAFNAAFRDRRFAPLAADEVATTRIEISVLSPAETIAAASRQDLLAQLQSGVDGLIVEDRGHRATFLPKVWEQLNSPQEFVAHLFVKAGLAADHWSQTLVVKRYRTINFAEN